MTRLRFTSPGRQHTDKILFFRRYSFRRISKLVNHPPLAPPLEGIACFLKESCPLPGGEGGVGLEIASPAKAGSQ